MAGISSHASGKMQNKDKTFQGQKFDDDLGINYDEFKWRNHDPQIGRFIEIDPLSEKYVYNSTYAFSENKVIGHIELEGLESMPFMSGNVGVDYLVNTVYGWCENLRNGKDNFIKGSNTIAASNTGQYDEQGLISAQMHSITGKLQQTAGLMEMNQPALEIAANIGLVAVGLEIPIETTFISEEPFGLKASVSFQGETGAIGRNLIKNEVTEVKGLGNPFKNYTLKEIDQGFQKQLENGKLIQKPSAPGAKTYQSKSGYSYNLDPGKQYKRGFEKPHIDVNYPKPKPKTVEKKKLEVNGGF